MMALSGLVFALAVFAFGVVIGWVEPGDLPGIGPWVEANLLLLLVGLPVLIGVAWVFNAWARKRETVAEATVRPVTPRERRNLIDAVHSRYDDLRGDLLQYEVGELLSTTGTRSRETVEVAVPVQARPDRVLRPLLRRRTPPEVAPPAPVDTLLDVYDEAAGRLLVLGAPGAGKSTFLLGLALDLLGRARDDEVLPVPVVVNLAAWAEKRRPLADWLEDRLPEVLGVSREFSGALIRGRHLHLLLDGLDEVEEAHRAACIQAINAYSGDRLEKVVVCCRTEEYEAVRDHLELTSAVEILPLDVDDVVRDLGAYPAAAEIRVALDNDSALREMTTTPLLLSVVLLTYLRSPIRSFGALPADQRMGELWDDYLVEMLSRRPRLDATRGPRYAPADVLRWLAWLVRKMKADDMTDFLLDRMQPEWLGHPARYRLVVGLVFGLIVGLVFGLAVGLFVGLVFGLGVRSRSIELTEAMHWDGRAAIEGLRRNWKDYLVIGLVIGLVSGLVFGLVSGLVSGLVVGLFSGLVIGLVRNGFVVLALSRTDRPGIRIQRTLAFGLVTGLVIGLFVGLGFWLIGELVIGLVFGLVFGLFLGLLERGGGALQHYVLRAMLVRKGHLPWRTATFLLHAADLLLLQRDRDLVRFRHLLLRDHLASENMTPYRLAELAARVREQTEGPALTD